MPPRCVPAFRRARSRAAAWVALLPGLTLLLGACATTYDPFRVPAEEVRGRVATIALTPFRIQADLGDRERLGPRVEALVRERLVEGGFEVVPMATVRDLWDRLATGVDPIFDPRTGARNPQRWQAVHDAVVRELVSAHGVDAVLYSWIETVDLYLVGRDVSFCGAERTLYWPGRYPGGTATLARTGCLYVQLRDPEDRLLYGIRYGLEVFETYAEQTRARRPVEERFDDAEALREAVEATVGPLVDRAGPR